MRFPATSDDWARLAAAVDPVARAAAAALLNVYDAPALDVAAKPDGSPVTAADLAAERALLAGLEGLVRGVGVVSEEGGGSGVGGRGPERYWLVDPLDGTREFLAHNGEFCVCIALVEDGAPVFGLIHAPTTSVSYYAWRGSGAAFAKPATDAPARRLPPRRPATARTPGLRVGVSRSHRDAATEAYLAKLDAPRAVPMGSALKFCAIVADRLDVYVRPGRTMHWDTAAGQCLLEAVGCSVTDLATGRPLRYVGPGRTNPGFLAGPWPA